MLAKNLVMYWHHIQAMGRGWGGIVTLLVASLIRKQG